jgi:lysophospholipase L1-like esterase
VRTSSLLTRIAVFLALIAGSSDLALAASKQSAVYYLALGDSLSVGAQPDLTGQNQPTSQGYADDLYAILLKRTPNLQLVKLGCIDETTGTMINGAGKCSYRSGSQLNEAVAFLNAHAGSVALVTIDIGANDLLPCVARGVIDPQAVMCINTAFSSIMTNLPYILSVLRTTGATVPIAAMNYYDPFLAAWLQGSAGQQLALQSAQLLGQFNDLLGYIYAGFGVPVGDVAKAFHTGNFDAVVFVPGLGKVPLNVALVCFWTWMCTPPPQGPNIHPNAVGYEVIAGAIFVVLPR